VVGKNALQGRKKQALITGAAGVLLGLPLTLSAGDAPAPVQVAPLPPATYAAPITQTAGPAAPQFRSQNYDTEVQRQLELLYQQDPNAGSQPNLPKPPPGPPQPKKMKMKDWFNPTAWKRYNKSKQRLREYEEKQRAAANAPTETDLGAPASMSMGGVAPLAPAASYAPEYPAPQTAAAQPLPQVVPAPAAVQIQPAPAPAAVAARPQLERVSPEIFQYPVEAGTAAPARETRTAEVAPAPQQLQLLPVPSSAAPTATEPAVAQTPTLLLTPEPQPAAAGTVPEAANGFFNETAERPAEMPVADATPQDLFAAEASPTEEVAEQNPFETEATGPYSGMELEDNPFAAPLEDSTSGPEAAAPATLPTFAAEAEAPADEPVAALLAPPPADTPAAAPAAIPTRLASESTPLAAPSPLPVTAEPQRIAATPVSASTAPSETQQKLSRIAERHGLTGFKGFCPVMLRDYRELVDAKLEHTTTYEGRQYWFSSAAAKETFLLHPAEYAPARGGNDVVIFDEVGEQREGSLDHAVWYRGRLYLFDSSETQAAFAAQPQLHQAE